ncbi:hypothetical protein KIN20_006322 [Parelaphostrongylus tenuis]|uniref:Uncharacterized protein n=1 Tax=Parelaphostrongylus tenuis TaxID=148309 RepID=A0AAD5MMG3_PARTN|nr:hypothetical protein KIN20_006322 [Parelaphostrongylus tenuis]
MIPHKCSAGLDRTALHMPFGRSLYKPKLCKVLDRVVCADFGSFVKTAVVAVAFLSAELPKLSNEIGETGKPLCIRVKEHLAGKRNSDPKTPLGTHKEQKHKRADFDVEFTVLAQE